MHVYCLSCILLSQCTDIENQDEYKSILMFLSNVRLFSRCHHHNLPKYVLSVTLLFIGKSVVD